MADGHVAQNPFHADCLRIRKKLREAPKQELGHCVLLKRMKVSARRFDDLMETLMQSGDVSLEDMETAGRPRKVYRLTGEGGEGRGERTMSVKVK